jgi:hypothetical protein
MEHKKHNPSKRANDSENQIHQLVFVLYVLKEGESPIVEETSK